MSRDTIGLLVLTLVMIPISIGLWRYATGRVREAERLRKLGWVCVGFNFLLGPIMVPGPYRGRWRYLGLESIEQTMRRVGAPSPRRIYRQKWRMRWEWSR